jgi:hypothetical protein
MPPSKKQPSPIAKAKALLAKDFILVPRHSKPKSAKAVQPPPDEYYQVHLDTIVTSYDT